MPLAFQRPPQSVFAAQRMTKTITQNIPEEQPAPPPEPTELRDFFRFYPLMPENEHTNKQSRGATPVNPLPKPREKANAPLRNHFLQQQQQQRPQYPQRAQQPPKTPMQQPPQPPQLPSQPQMIPPQQFQRPVQPQMIPPHQLPQQQPQMPPIQQPQMAPMPQQPQMMPPPSPPSPENAAQHFRNINKNLPDGVMYEPLDDDIMRLLKDNGHLTKAQPKNPPAPPPTPPPTAQSPPPQTPPTTIVSSEVAKSIENLTQNERNAQVFYTGISHISQTEEIKKSLLLLAEGSKSRTSQYLNILHAHFDSKFTPQEKEINTNLSFEDAISLAITEENKALSTLCSLLDQVEGTSLERQIERIISKKVVAHQLLLTIHTTTIPAPRSLRYPPLSPDASL